jgi:hypothetical protein
MRALETLVRNGPSRLEAKKVTFRVLSISGNQPLDTSTSTGRLMLSVYRRRGSG